MQARSVEGSLDRLSPCLSESAPARRSMSRCHRSTCRVARRTRPPAPSVVGLRDGFGRRAGATRRRQASWMVRRRRGRRRTRRIVRRQRRGTIAAALHVRSQLPTTQPGTRRCSVPPTPRSERSHRRRAPNHSPTGPPESRTPTASSRHDPVPQPDHSGLRAQHHRHQPDGLAQPNGVDGEADPLASIGTTPLPFDERPSLVIVVRGDLAQDVDDAPVTVHESQQHIDRRMTNPRARIVPQQTQHVGSRHRRRKPQQSGRRSHANPCSANLDPRHRIFQRGAERRSPK